MQPSLDFMFALSLTAQALSTAHNTLFAVCDHRALAAFLAICLRVLAVSFFARALPPLSPPSRPSATAAAFFFALAMPRKKQKRGNVESRNYRRSSVSSDRSRSIPGPVVVDHALAVAYLTWVMSGHRKKRKQPKLPKALVEELKLQKLTYEDAIKGCDGIPNHQRLLKALRDWRLKTPHQKACWDQWAREHNLAGGDPAARN